MDGDTIGRLGYLTLLLVAVGGWVLVEFRGRLGFALRSGMAWGLIFLGAMAGYGLWGDIHTQIMPVQVIGAGGQIEVPRAGDGHYYLTLVISGTPVRFMVDTGASNVVLSQQDARRLGIEPAGLLYMGQASTANGVVRTARVKLADVALGPVWDATLTAWVNDAEMDGSLLGMDYLGRFQIAISNNKMTLTR
ncbi:MAG: TIGR02281 family clan AA aspartic protease [Pseudorhodobacter sp.]|nr:TIGR02281 family clan AA aspartic protease [Pseudorhodobacter sp.]